jgi:hypothetical protein
MLGNDNTQSVCEACGEARPEAQPSEEQKSVSGSSVVVIGTKEGGDMGCYIIPLDVWTQDLEDLYQDRVMGVNKHVYPDKFVDVFDKLVQQHPDWCQNYADFFELPPELIATKPRIILAPIYY